MLYNEIFDRLNKLVPRVSLVLIVSFVVRFRELLFLVSAQLSEILKELIVQS